MLAPHVFQNKQWKTFQLSATRSWMGWVCLRSGLTSILSVPKVLFMLIRCSLTDPVFAIILLLLLLVHIYNFYFNSPRLLASSGIQLCLIQIQTWLVCFMVLGFFPCYETWWLVQIISKKLPQKHEEKFTWLTGSLVSNYIKYLYKQLKVSSESFWLPLM